MPVPAALATLSLEERGYLVGAARLGDERLFQRLSGGPGERCLAAWKAWSSLDRQGRVAALAALTAEALAVLPSGLEDLHLSWIREALASEPSDLVLALTLGGPRVLREAGEEVLRGRSRDPARVEPRVASSAALDDLGRAVWGPLALLTATATASAAGPLGTRLSALSLSELLDEVARWGAEIIGRSLVGAPTAIRARAMAAVGEPWAGEIERAAATASSAEARERARTWAVRAASEHVASPVERLRAAGLLALAEALGEEGPASRRRVAGRLPRAMGRLLL